MPMTKDDIEQSIRAAIPDAVIEVRDLRGDGEHYAATVLSPMFQGLPRVRQHKMVYDAFKGGVGTQLHALSLTTGVPDSSAGG